MALTQKQTMGAAHPRVVICVSLRTAASAEAPLSPIWLAQRLQRVGVRSVAREQVCQRALTGKQTLGGGGALQRGHGAPLEPLAQLGDALRGVGAVAMTVDAAELVVAQPAKGTRSVNGR